MTVWRTVYFLVLFTTIFVHEEVSAACGSIPSNWPVLAGSKLKIEKNVSVNGNAVPKNDFNGGYDVNPSTGAVQSVSTTFPTLDPPTFPSFTGGTNLTTPSTVTAGTYGTITVNDGSNTPDTVFTGGTYYIDKLDIKSGATVQLAPGDYYMKNLEIDKNATLTVSPAGVVRIYLNNDPDIDDSVTFNSGGSAANLQFYLYPGANSFKMGKDASFTGIVYAPGASQEIEIDKDSTITGTLLTAGEIKLEKDIVLNYSTATQAQVASVRTCQSGAGGGSGGTNPVNFNCVESGADASAGTLYTKLAGTPFSFDVVALKIDGNIETGYANSTNKNVTVKLVDGAGIMDCASRIALSPAVSQTLTFAAANVGRKAIAAMTVGKAYPNLRCCVTDANQSPSIIGCSTDNFAVRPTNFSVTSNINADATGVSTSASPAIKTGASFTLTAASGTAGYKYTPQLDASKLTAHAGAIQSGALAGSFAVADVTTGTATGETFTYSEAGYFQLAANGVFDDSFTTVDSATNDCTNDFSNVLVSGKYGCKFGNAAATNYFGRFIPDHFVVTQGLATPACGTVFTYFGQDGFTTSFTLTAQNANNAPTQNYTGSLAKLALTAWNNFIFTSTGLPAGSTLSASDAAPTGNWSNGVAGVIAKHQVNRPTALTGQTTVIVNTSPVDTDGVTMVTAPVAPGTPLRYGRVNLGNAHGSELLDLAVPMTAEYFNGTSFITNTDDVCSVSGISITDPLSTDSLVPADSCIWDDNSTSGVFKCATAAPTGTTYREANSLSAGNFNLNLKAPGKTGALDITGSVANWLQFDWHGTGTTNPSARATFGIYKGNQKIIYFREVY